MTRTGWFCGTLVAPLVQYLRGTFRVSASVESLDLRVSRDPSFQSPRRRRVGELMTRHRTPSKVRGLKTTVRISVSLLRSFVLALLRPP